MSRARIRAIVAALALIATAALCAHSFWKSATAVQMPHSSVRAPHAVPVELAANLSTLIERTHFAYVRHGDSYEGGDVTYAVSVAGSEVAFRADERSAPLTLRTTAVQRDGVLVSTSAPFDRAADGHLDAARGDEIVEQLNNTAVGVEQSWTFTKRPAGSGDLVLRIAAGGQSFVGATVGGLHFADPDTGIGTCYSHAKWVDANGETSAVRVAYVDGAIVARVPVALVERTSYPAVLDPTISGEIATDQAMGSGAQRWIELRIPGAES